MFKIVVCVCVCVCVCVLFVSARPFKVFNRLTDFHEIWYERLALEDIQTAYFFHCLY